MAGGWLEYRRAIGPQVADHRVACCQNSPSRVYSAAFPKFYLRVPPAMEINPILNSIKDLSERTQTIRGYL